jgi:hypothetical protein
MHARRLVIVALIVATVLMVPTAVTGMAGAVIGDRTCDRPGSLGGGLDFTCLSRAATGAGIGMAVGLVVGAVLVGVVVRRDRRRSGRCDPASRPEGGGDVGHARADD